MLDLVERPAASCAGSDAFEPEFAPARLGEIERSCLAVGRARDVLGWTSGTRIEEGLRLTWEASEHA